MKIATEITLTMKPLPFVPTGQRARIYVSKQQARLHELEPRTTTKLPRKLKKALQRQVLARTACKDWRLRDVEVVNAERRVVRYTDHVKKKVPATKGWLVTGHRLGW